MPPRRGNGGNGGNGGGGGGGSSSKRSKPTIARADAVNNNTHVNNNTNNAAVGAAAAAQQQQQPPPQQQPQQQQRQRRPLLFTRESASVRLQAQWRRVWRNATTARLVERLQQPQQQQLQAAASSADADDGLTMDRCRTISFEALVVFLRERRTIARARACLWRIHWLTERRHGEWAEEIRAAAADGRPAVTVNVRVFLAAFMIAARPAHVFDSPGAPLESALLEASRAVPRRWRCTLSASAAPFASRPAAASPRCPTR